VVLADERVGFFLFPDHPPFLFSPKNGCETQQNWCCSPRGTNPVLRAFFFFHALVFFLFFFVCRNDFFLELPPPYVRCLLFLFAFFLFPSLVFPFSPLFFFFPPPALRIELRGFCRRLGAILSCGLFPAEGGGPSGLLRVGAGEGWGGVPPRGAPPCFRPPSPSLFFLFFPSGCLFFFRREKERWDALV